MSYFNINNSNINTIDKDNNDINKDKDNNVKILIEGKKENYIINKNIDIKNEMETDKKKETEIQPKLQSQSYIETDTDTDTDTEIIDKIFNKEKIVERIQTKINKLDKRMKYIDYKYEEIRKSYRYYSLSIIYFASILTLLEGFINTINLSTIIKYTILIKLINFIPLILSTLITLCGTLIKYNSFEERIEEIIRVKDKSILTLAKFKNLIEDLYFCDDSNYRKKKKIIDNYKNNAYTDYLDCQTKIEKFLKYKDYKKYIPKVKEFESIIDTENGWNEINKSNNQLSNSIKNLNNKNNDNKNNSLFKKIKEYIFNKKKKYNINNELFAGKSTMVNYNN